MAGPVSLGLGYTQQSGGAPVSYGVAGDDMVSRIAAMITQGFGGGAERRQQRAATEESRERTLDARGYRAAREELGNIIANSYGNVNVIPNMTVGDENTMAGAPTIEDTQALQEAAARSALTPELIAQIIGARVRAGGAAEAGGSIDDILANMAVAAGDEDRQVGFRGQILSPGQSVTQTGANANFNTQETNDVAMNDADNSTARRGQDMDYAGRRYVADVAAAVDRENIGVTERASRTELELARAGRLDQQNMTAAFQAAVGGGDVRVPPEFRQRVLGRMAELLSGNDALDTTTAAVLALDELTDETEEGTGFLGMGARRRRLRYTDAGEGYAPRAPTPRAAVAAPAQVAPTLPEGAQVDERGNVYDAQGRPLGYRVRQ